MNSSSSTVGAQDSRGSRIALRILAAALLAYVAYACARFAFWNAFTSFQSWDDEGYFLLALREFSAGGGLYDRIQGVFYGPVYFQTVAALSWLTRMPLDNESARWLMLLAWFAALLALGYVSWRLTRSLLAPAIVLSTGFPYLFFFTNEPLHATSVVLLYVAPLLLVLAGPLGDGKVPRAAPLTACGALCAAVFLVKSNLGVCIALGIAATFAGNVCGRLGSVVRSLAALALVILPFALMRPLLGLAWVTNYALLVAISLAPFAVALFRPADRSVGGRQILIACAGGAAVLAGSLGGALLTSTTPAGLWRALVVEALEFPLKNHYAPPGLPRRGEILLFALAIPVALALRRRTSALAVLRLAASLFLLVEGLRMQTPFASLPLVWIAASGERESRTRYALGVLTVLSSLQAYPIAGCQVGLFSLLAMLVGTIGLHDALREIAWVSALPSWVRVPVAGAALLAAGRHLLAEHPVWSAERVYRERWTFGVPLELPGTGRMRLFELQTAQMRWVALNLRRNADTFVGVPGMHSFHLWSGVPPPVPFYKHHWVLFRDEAEERALARGLAEAERPCVLFSRGLVGFWLHAELPDGPIRSALDAGYVSVAAAGPYELMVPRAQERQLVLTARPIAGFDVSRQEHEAERVFTLNLPALDGVRVARVTVINTRSGIEILDSGARAPTRRLVVTDAAGRVLLRGHDSQIVDARDPTRLLMLWPRIERELDPDVLVVRAYDTEGRIVARCLVLGLGQGS